MKNILLIGCGKMGTALLRGWQEQTEQFIPTVIDPSAPQADYRSIKDIPDKPDAQFDAVILAVKPQTLPDIMADLHRILHCDTLVLSIAAGKTLAFLQDHLPEKTPAIRAMPNTPAAIGAGITALCANEQCKTAHKDLATTLMQAAGSVEWISDEHLMDAITALSGSGPAYVFHLIEAMTQGGVTAGLPEKLAENLARQTVIGAALLAQAEPDISAATLRQNVTSPNGTTAAALEILMSPNGSLTNLMTRTIRAATTRSCELAG